MMCSDVVLRCLGGVVISGLGIVLRRFGVVFRGNISSGVIV
jgi:hypothetical protein